jgi:hypothetical protein
MNANRLIRQYEKLTPWERVPAIIAARDRGDKVEADRLAQTAPTETWSIVNFKWVYESLHILANFYALELLDLAAFYYEASAAWGEDYLHLGKKEAKEAKKRREESRRMICFLFVRKADMWQAFCAGAGVDPQALFRELPGFERIRRFEELARDMALSPEEAAAFLERIGPSGRGDGPPIKVTFASAAEDAKELRAAVDAMLTA